MEEPQNTSLIIKLFNNIINFPGLYIHFQIFVQTSFGCFVRLGYTQNKLIPSKVQILLFCAMYGTYLGVLQPLSRENLTSYI